MNPTHDDHSYDDSEPWTLKQVVTLLLLCAGAWLLIGLAAWGVA